MAPTYKDLYNELLDMDNNEPSFTHYIKTKWESGGEKQESIFRLFAYLGLIPEFSSYTICSGNFNQGTIKAGADLNTALNASVKDKGDKSDLTLQNINDPKQIIATTSKNLNHMGVNKLDISDIYDIFNKTYLKNDFKITLCVVVRDRSKLFNVIQNAERTSDLNKQRLLDKSTIIFDWHDIAKWHVKFIDIFAGREFTEVIKAKRHPLLLKFHQQIAVQKTKKLHNAGYKDVLWGHIPRSGKSYIVAGVIEAFNATNCLLITTAPNESIDQYVSMFNSIQSFQDYKVHTLRAQDSTRKPVLSTKNIFICSKQYLQCKLVTEETTGRIKTIKWLRDLPIDIRFLDESHNGGTTDLAKRILDTYVSRFTVYITATYLKPITDFSIPLEAQILWDLEDVNLCKTIDTTASQKRLTEKYGIDMEESLKYLTVDSVKKTYEMYPSMQFMSLNIDADVKSSILDYYEQNGNAEDGFSIEAILMLKNSGERIEPKFADDDVVYKLCETIFGKAINPKSKSKVVIEKKDSILNRIKRFCAKPEFSSRWFSKEEPLIILCFLPCNIKGMPLELIQEALKTFIQEKGFLDGFDTVIINSKENSNPKTVVSDAYTVVVNSNKRGLLVLSGKQCAMAVTFPKCDIVLLLNNSSSMDMIYQMMFRCMTEDVNKKLGFVIDLNLQRVANIIVDYSLRLFPKKMGREAVKTVLTQNLIGFNNDLWMGNIFGTTPHDVDSMVSGIYKIWGSQPTKRMEDILNKLHFKMILLSNEDQKLINALFKITNAKAAKSIIEALKSNDVDIKTGLTRENIPQEQEQEQEQEPNKGDVNLIRDVIKYLIPVICLLTIHDCELTTFEAMCHEIAGRKDEHEVLKNQLSTWWGQNNRTHVFDISLFLKLYNMYLVDKSEINEVIMRIKEVLCEAKEPHRLSELIDKYLVPHELEKKQNAEVSTPKILRREMLDSIPSEFWTTPKKVFEPCAGKGGFVIDIIDRFMNGLKTFEPDENKRYRLIIEECLYWCDINPTNVYICKLLISMFGNFKINYYEGNTLKLDIKTKWGLDGFDAVIGNPPYNDGSGNKGGGHTLWTQFIERALNSWLSKDGYLTFINPSLWRQVDHALLKLFQNYQMLYLEIHNEKDGMKMFKCNTRYDWYTVKKTPQYRSTTIIDEIGVKKTIMLKEWRIIPNFMFDEIKMLMAKPSEKPCEIIKDESSYEGRKKHMSKVESISNKYPCVYSVNRQNTPTFMWSSINDKGHFGVSKVIYGCGATGFISDPQGKYGLTQWCSGIICPPEDHLTLIKVLNGEKFKQVKLALAVSKAEINTKNLRLFKDKWWSSM